MTDTIEGTDRQISLPTSWLTCKLNDLVEVSKDKAEPNKVAANTCYIGLEHIERATGTLLGYGSSAEVRSTKSRFREGELLYGKLRPYLNKVYAAEFDGICSTDILVLRPLGGISTKYLQYRLLSDDFVRYTSGNVSGVQHPRVNAQIVSRFDVELPPLNEQRRIVKKIEELFTKLDAGVRSLKQTRALLKSYRRSALKAAVEGELSREWREAHGDEVEPASELLKRILQKRREKFAGERYKEPAFPDTSELPALPDGWEWTSLSAIANTQLGKMLSQAAKTGSGSRPYLRNQNIRWGSIDTSDVLMMDFDEREVEKFSLLSGDVLICEGGEPGRAAVWNEQLPGAMYQKALHRVRVVGSAIKPEYIVYHLRKDASEGALNRYFTGSTIKHFTGVALAKYAISLPPLEEQHFIVEEVERRFSVVDKLEATVEENLKQAGSLRQSILKQAFSGELVPQDPEDEPASMLLARIREERPAIKQKVSKGRRRKTASNKSSHAEQEGLF